MNLSKHFTLKELTHSDISVRHNLDNSPSSDVIFNLTRLATFMEAVRSLFAKPIIINSAYRSPAVNNLLGSRPTSQHCFGCAADFRINGLTPDQIVKKIVASNIPYDQVIREFDSWVHISIPLKETIKPRKQALIIDKSGTRPYA